MSLHARTSRLTLLALPRLLRAALLGVAAGACLPLHAADAAPEADPTMPAVTVTGQAAQATEGTRSYTGGEAHSATRMELSLRETPQSVSIITRELLDDLGAVRLDQALGLTTGIQVGQQDSERTSFYARGFSINTMKVGGSATAQSATYGETWYGRPPTRDYTAHIPQAGYALFSLMASYALTPKTTVQLNVSNLLDKKYYRNVGFYDSVFWGEPRNVNLGLRTRF